MTARSPFEKLLVPTDFSRGAEMALGRALLLPLAKGATIDVIHVLPKNISAKARASAAATAKRQLEAIVSRARQAPAAVDIELTWELQSGEPFVEIIRRSRSIGAELIVIGRHGKRPIRDMFIGTTAERVIREGGAPVLAVNLEPAHPYRRPLIATDLEEASPRVFDVALRVLGPGVKRARVVHAFHVPYETFVTPTVEARKASDYRRSFRERAMARMATLLAKYEDTGIRWKATFRADDPRSVVLSEVTRARADLLAVGTHARSGLAHALLGSVAEWVISSAPCDVLVARPTRFSFELP